MSGLSRLTANQGGSIFVTSSVCQAVQGRNSRPSLNAWLGIRGSLVGRGHERLAGQGQRKLLTGQCPVSLAP